MKPTINSRVHLTVDIDGQPVPGELGTITVPVHNGTVDLPGVRRALGELLVEAGNYLISGGQLEELPGTSQGVGVSESPE